MMNNSISPKYQMVLIKDVYDAIFSEYKSYENVRFYIKKWHTVEDENGFSYEENFQILKNENGKIDLNATLNSMDGSLLIKIAIDLGVHTPDFIPSIPTFKNEIKSNFETAYATFEKAFKQIEEHPDLAIGLVNSALESIIKEILKVKRFLSSGFDNKTLYDLTQIILKEFQMYPNSTIPIEIKTIGSALLTVCQQIEKLRSEKTHLHGKTIDDYVIDDALYTYFIFNSVSTIGLFLLSFYKVKFPKLIDSKSSDRIDDLPF